MNHARHYTSGVTVLRNVDALATEFPGALVGLSEFARLLGLGESGEAALRAARQRVLTTTAPFPPAVAESGRSMEHRLRDLVDWVADNEWLDAGRSSRRAGSGRSARQPDENESRRAIAAWRLHRLLLDYVKLNGTTEARKALAHFVLAPAATELPAQVRKAVTAARELDGVLDDVLVGLALAQPGVPNRSSAPIALLTTLALDVPEGGIIHDATCGECEVLIQTWRLASLDAGAPPVLTGNDLDQDSKAIGEARLALAGAPALLGVDPPADSLDRLVIDPGWDAKLPDLLDEMLRALKRDGSVAIVTRLRNDVLANLLRKAPPRTIVIPPQRAAGSRGPVAIWVSEPLRDPPSRCRIIDLRRETNDRPSRHDRDDRVGRLWEALGSRHSIPDVNDLGWGDVLDEAAPIKLSPRDITDAPLAALQTTLEQLIAGRKGFSDPVIDENRVYALHLAQELRRLIDTGDSHGQIRKRPGAPTDSPDGVLAQLATNEARRVIERLVRQLAAESKKGK